ncbi:hypothetical protein TrVGV298_001754 [Trichoderma virens]|nr:hypothetical protein TrVGV298_001754 [Trichoderma virens]
MVGTKALINLVAPAAPATEGPRLRSDRPSDSPQQQQQQPELSVRRWRLDYGVQRGTGHSFVLSKYSLRSQLTRSTDGAGAYPKGRPTRRTAISTAYVRFYRGAWYRPPSNVKRTGPTGG